MMIDHKTMLYTCDIDVLVLKISQMTELVCVEWAPSELNLVFPQPAKGPARITQRMSV